MTQVFINRTDGYYKTISCVSDIMDNELTVSHVFRTGNEFTSYGLPYGEILAKKLGVRDGMNILEIGPGLGDIAENLLRAVSDFHYTFMDISYDAVKNLKKRFTGRKYSFIVGDFLKEKFRDKFDLVICNEVVADFPTIVNMTMYAPKLKDEDRDEYFDAVSLIKFFGLSLPKVSNFNYGAVKFLDKARTMLAENGKIFLCEHSSDKPKRIPVLGHNEYSIDFSLLEKVADRLKFAKKERGTLTGLLGVSDKKAVLFYTRPELKMLYAFLKRSGVLIDQKAYAPEEAVETLRKAGVALRAGKAYAEYLEERAKSLREITDQFNYLILES